MEIKQMLLTPNPYSRPQKPIQKVNAVAVHYVGNPGSTAMNNRDYFESLKNKKQYASSHYIVGLGGEIIQCIPENEYSYCTNQRNKDSISIETCHPTSDGHFNQVSIDSLIWLIADISKRHELNPLNGGMIRHFDVTKKKCPLYYVNHPDKWAELQIAVAKAMKPVVTEVEKGEGDEKMEKYKRLADLPDWQQPIIQRYIDKGIIKGKAVNPESGEIIDLGLTPEQIENAIIAERMVERAVGKRIMDW